MLGSVDKLGSRVTRHIWRVASLSESARSSEDNSNPEESEAKTSERLNGASISALQIYDTDNLDFKVDLCFLSLFLPCSLTGCQS